jgi:hypothetical protein
MRDLYIPESTDGKDTSSHIVQVADQVANQMPVFRRFSSLGHVYTSVITPVGENSLTITSQAVMFITVALASAAISSRTLKHLSETQENSFAYRHLLSGPVRC